MSNDIGAEKVKAKAFRDSLKSYKGTATKYNFNGTQCRATFLMAADEIEDVGLVHISVSAYRAKTPVRTLGVSTARGYARGNRTVAGTLVFTMGLNHPMVQMLGIEVNNNSLFFEKSLIPDMIEPFDIILTLTGEENVKSFSGLAKIKESTRVDINKINEDLSGISGAPNSRYIYQREDEATGNGLQRLGAEIGNSITEAYTDFWTGIGDVGRSLFGDKEKVKKENPEGKMTEALAPFQEAQEARDKIGYGYGEPMASKMEILGVELLSDSVNVSMNDQVIEVIANYVALAYVPFHHDKLIMAKPLFGARGDEVVEKIKQYKEIEKKLTQPRSRLEPNDNLINVPRGAESDERIPCRPAQNSYLIEGGF